MAGICGIVLKEKAGKTNDYANILSIMLSKLGSGDSQPMRSESSLLYHFGIVAMFSDKEIKKFLINDDLGVSCVIDGLVYVDLEHKKLINQQYKIKQELSDEQYLPYLYVIYGIDFIKKITGWYNVFIFDKKSNSGILFNDRLGYLPLFYYENPSLYIFSSKIESIIASGLLPSVEFDLTSIAEHLFFNYTLSDSTFIKGIKTLGPASQLQFNSEGSGKTDIYWNFKELYVAKPSNKKEGIKLLDAGLKKALNKLTSIKCSSFNVSLTGGWDSRVVLSSLMPIKERLHLFSFGAKNAPDITIPKSIAISESISYTPYILNEHYLQEEFTQNALTTINNSNGARSFKRAHYNYVFKKISHIADTVVSGNYGDEVLKIAGLKPGDVISKNAIDFIASNFDVESITEKFKANNLLHGLILKTSHIDEFKQRMGLVRDSVSGYKTISEKYYHCRFLVVLRKYFGAEVNSYNDYCYNFSPFIDIDFLSAYFKSYYCGAYYPFNPHSLLLKQQTTSLYCKLIRRNNEELAKYPTDRGYSMVDTLRLKGIVKIIISRLFRQRNNKDTFNTNKTDEIFKEILAEDAFCKKLDSLPLNYKEIIDKGNHVDLSLFYWLAKISGKYVISRI